MLNKLMTLMLFGATIVAILPLFLVKQYILTGKWYYLGICILNYLILLYLYVNIFSQPEAEISNLYVLFQIIQILVILLVGIIYYKEKLNWSKFFGISLGIISIYILNL
jgi:multidrug transporter EmrE-like cation transporter